MNADAYLNSLLNSPLGQSLGDEACRALLQRGEVRGWPGEAIIFLERDPAEALFIVLEGRVKLTRYTWEGREVIIHFAEPVQMIAEAALSLGRYPATAVAEEDTVLLRLGRETIDELIAEHPPFTRHLFHSMAAWLKRLVDKIDQLTLNDATSRLVRYLMDLCDSAGVRSGRECRVELPVKKGDLALMLNMNQATLSRSLRRLMDEELIQVDNRLVTVFDTERLQSYAMPPLD